MRNDHNESGLHAAVRPVLGGILLLAASTQPSHAYVDPGTGSMLLQMAIAGIAGALFFFRQLRMQFTSWFRRTVLGRADERPVGTPVSGSTSNDAD